MVRRQRLAIGAVFPHAHWMEAPQSSRPDSVAGNFGTTRWTMIFAAAADGDVVSSRALARLCETYWPPVYAFIRRSGRQPEDAKDLTQAFFVHLLEKRQFEAADPEKGKFRNYLLGAVKFFLGNEWQKQQAQKRGGQVAHFSIEQLCEGIEENLAGQMIGSVTPETLYERQWATTLLERVNEALRLEYAQRDKGDLFEILQPFLAGRGDSDVSYAEVAAAHHQSEAAVKMAASRMRKRFGEILREMIAETVDSPEAVDEEIRHMLRAFQ
jgi:RNA polymerase sigma factor (sigma-70 family)